jgi:putative zinc finger/helix-turn-helix YgiT family protein
MTRKKEPMKRCHNCKSDQLVEKTLSETIEVAGNVFTAQLPALVCEACGEASYAGEDLHRFEWAVARELAETGKISGEALRFMRKSISLKAVELAQLLGITPETLSRWEKGKLEVDEKTFLIVGDLVEDYFAGNTRTRRRLLAIRASKTNPPPSGVSKIVIALRHVMTQMRQLWGEVTLPETTEQFQQQYGAKAQINKSFQEDIAWMLPAEGNKPRLRS